MIKLKEEIFIDRPVEEVFTFLTTLENIPKWQAALSSHVITEGPMGVGTRFEESFKMMGRTVDVECEITEYEHPRKLGWKSTSSDVIAFDSRWLFDSANSGTNVRFAGESSLKGVWRLAEPFVGGEFRRGLKAELEKLRDVVEAEAATT
jgi:uncharacterized protein YndB with AHSA1/START domain